MAKKSSFKNLIVYGGLEKEEYHHVRGNIRMGNLKIWRIGSVILGLISLLMCVLNYLLPEIFSNPFYIMGSVSIYSLLYLCLAMFGFLMAILLFIFGKRFPKTINFFVILIHAVILIFFIGISTLLDKDNLSVAYMVMIVGVSLTTVRRPIVNVTVVFISTALYVTMAHFFMIDNAEVFKENVIYASIFGGGSLVVGVFFNIIRIKDYGFRFYVEEQKDTDLLTNVGSRSAFDKATHILNEKIKTINLNMNKEPPKFAVVVFDISSLKQFNDTYGREMGDQLLIRTVELIRNTFTNSDVYRVSGDKFVTLLEKKNYIAREAQVKIFRDKIFKLNDTARTAMDDVPVACGMAIFEEDRDIDFTSVYTRASESMFEDKKMIKTRREHSSREAD